MPDAQPDNEPEQPLEPSPMLASPTLHALSWLGGVTIGGMLVSVLCISTTSAAGATKAYRAQWQLHHGSHRQSAASEQQPTHRTSELPAAVDALNDRANCDADNGDCDHVPLSPRQ